MTDPLKKTYSQDLKQTVTGILVLLTIGLIVWGISALIGYNDPDDRIPVRREPTQAEINNWNREADCMYTDEGCQWDNRWGQ